MMQVFFQMEACGDFDVNHRESYMNMEKLQQQEEYCSDLYSLICNKHDEIDQMLARHSKGWKISRMPKTDLAVLRLSACELMYLQNIPEAVSINEAVELAKKYGTEDSPRYVNAILGRVCAEDGRDG